MLASRARRRSARHTNVTPEPLGRGASRPHGCYGPARHHEKGGAMSVLPHHLEHERYGNRRANPPNGRSRAGTDRSSSPLGRARQSVLPARGGCSSRGGGGRRGGGLGGSGLGSRRLGRGAGYWSGDEGSGGRREGYLLDACYEEP